MAQAYATIANGGTLHEAQCIQEIRNSSGQVLFSADTTGEKVISTDLTEAATEVMEGVVTSGTGRNASLSSGQVVAGKTGTSENYRDKWFCGITPQITVAIWIGDRNEKSMSSSVAADSIFGDFVGKLLKGSELEEFPKGAGTIKFTTTDIGHGSGSTGKSVSSEGARVDEDDDDDDSSEESTAASSSSSNSSSSSTSTSNNSSSTSGSHSTSASSNTSSSSSSSTGSSSSSSSGSSSSSSSSSSTSTRHST
jgi:penicillin-binding protein 1A